MKNNILIHAAPCNSVLVSCCAICLWLGFPNNIIEFPLLLLGWPLFLFLSAIQSTWKRSFFYCWLGSFLGGNCALYWLSLPLRTVGQLPMVPAFLCAILISACLALQSGFFGIIIRQFYILSFFPAHLVSPLSAAPKLDNLKLSRHFHCRRIIFFLIGSSLLWFILEYAFALLFGFPWLTLGGGLCVWPLLVQTASFLGVWFSGSLWIIPLLGSLFFLLSFKKTPLYITFVSLVIFVGYGIFSLSENESGEAVNALVVEGNIDQNQKWQSDFQLWTIDRYIKLTQDGLEKEKYLGKEKPLIIWPETAMPFFFEKNMVLANLLFSAVKKFDCPLLFGAPGIANEESNFPETEVYNRAFLISPAGKIVDWYDKEHLVPFGEYVPEWLNFKFLDALLQGVGIYKSGNSAVPLKYGNWSLGMLICYEGIFPWLAAERVKSGSNILIDISNDGWFGTTPAAKQHLYLTAGRCIENDRWLFRGTNNGISASIDNRGRIKIQGKQFTAESFSLKGNLLNTNSAYTKIYYYLPLFAFLLFITIVVSLTRKKSESV